MLKFKEVKIEDAKLLNQYYSNCSYESSEYSVGIKCFWNKFYPYEYAISNDCLIIKYKENENTVFDMPVPSPNGDINKALDQIDEYCIKNGIVPLYSDVPVCELQRLIQRYNFTKIENYRESEDYVYKRTDLMEFKGKHYSGQRNHINKFKSLFTKHIFRSLKSEDDLNAFWNEFYSQFDKASQSAMQEKQVAIEMTAQCKNLDNFFAGCIEVDEQIAAISVAELRGNTAIIHIEKALTKYEGIYPLMVLEFTKNLPAHIEWINREDDSSDRGLRISKLQYRPNHLVAKYVVLVQSELLYVESIPRIQTQRLILDEIKSSDADEYQRLCLDEKRNIYWGYDYKDDLDEELLGKPLPKDYFYQVAKNDFKERMCLNLAIRFEEKFIGEVVLYEADYKGSIEIGCRIFEEYGGNGFGKEAIEAASNWAIYSAGFRKIKAKCFKENTASYKMLSSFMKKADEDENYYYFEKLC